MLLNNTHYIDVVTSSIQKEESIKMIREMTLKKIIKENHGHNIIQILFNKKYPNMIVTVGGTQLNIYNNENFGEHLDLVFNFVNIPTPAIIYSRYLRKHNGLPNNDLDLVSVTNQIGLSDCYDEDIFIGDPRFKNGLNSEIPQDTSHSTLVSKATDNLNPFFSNKSLLINHAAWVNFSRSFTDEISIQPEVLDDTDTWLAFCSNDGFVHLISIAYAKVLYVLNGHFEPVLKLATWKGSSILASLSRKKIILWKMKSLSFHYFNSYNHNGDCPNYDDIIFQEIDISHLPSIETISFCSFGLLAGGEDGCLFLWPWVVVIDIATNTLKVQLSTNYIELDTLTNKNILNIVAYPLSKNKFLILDSNSNICVYNLFSNNTLYNTFCDDIKICSDIQSTRHLLIKSRGSKKRFTGSLEISNDENFIIVGTNKGHTDIYDIESGELIHSLRNRRSKRPINGCFISYNYKNILVISDAMVWRWEYVQKKKQRKKIKFILTNSKRMKVGD